MICEPAARKTWTRYSRRASIFGLLLSAGLVKMADDRLRDPASWLPLAAGQVPTT